MSEQLVITDAFVICSAPNDRQVKAIVDGVEERLRGLGAKPVRREGEREGRWVLLDYIDVIVHVQHAEERVYYALERTVEGLPDGRAAGGGTPGPLAHDPTGPPGRPGPRPDAGRGRRVVIWRHGQTGWNLEGRFQGQIDVELDEAGRDQAGALPGCWRRCDRTRSSPRTCGGPRSPPGCWPGSPVVDVQLDPRLRETHGGAWQGLTDSRDPGAVRRDFDAWVHGADIPAEGAEGRSDVAARVAPAITDALRDVPPGETLVVVTHGGAARSRDRLDARPAAWTLDGRSGRCPTAAGRCSRSATTGGGCSSTTPAACPSRCSATSADARFGWPAAQAASGADPAVRLGVPAGALIGASTTGLWRSW